MTALAPAVQVDSVTVSGDTTTAVADAVPSTFETVTVAVRPAESRTMIGSPEKHVPRGVTVAPSPLCCSTKASTVNAEAPELCRVYGGFPPYTKNAADTSLPAHWPWKLPEKEIVSGATKKPGLEPVD